MNTVENAFLSSLEVAIGDPLCESRGSVRRGTQVPHTPHPAVARTRGDKENRAEPCRALIPGGDGGNGAAPLRGAEHPEAPAGVEFLAGSGAEPVRPILVTQPARSRNGKQLDSRFPGRQDRLAVG